MLGLLEDSARRRMMKMVERILEEAELASEAPKLNAYGRSLMDLRELLHALLGDPRISKQLMRQVAFLFDLDEVEHTTVVGLTLRDILRDARQKLKPWELAKGRKVRGFRWSKIPSLAYSQAFCFYKVLPEHTEGPAIGITYDEE